MTRVDQQRTNPSQAISNFKGRWDSVFAWPSTAISTWLNGGLFGGGVWTETGGSYNAKTTVGDRTSYVWTADGTIENTAGYVDIIMVGGGGAGSSGGTGQLGGGGGAGGFLFIEDVFMPAGAWTIDVGGSHSETFIYSTAGGITDPLEDARMGSNADAKANFAVSASKGGNGGGDDGGDPSGDHALNDEQKGSGGGAGHGGVIGGGGSHGTGGTSGDIGNNGANGLHAYGYWGAGGGGGAGSIPDANPSYGGAITDGGDGVGNSFIDLSTTTYFAVGGSADLWTPIWVATGNKNDLAVYEDLGGKSMYQSSVAAGNGAANTGSGGGGGYTVSGSGGSGIVGIITRAEDA